LKFNEVTFLHYVVQVAQLLQKDGPAWWSVLAKISVEDDILYQTLSVPEN